MADVPESVVEYIAERAGERCGESMQRLDRMIEEIDESIRKLEEILTKRSGIVSDRVSPETNYADIEIIEALREMRARREELVREKEVKRIRCILDVLADEINGLYESILDSEDADELSAAAAAADALAALLNSMEPAVVGVAPDALVRMLRQLTVRAIDAARLAEEKAEIIRGELTAPREVLVISPPGDGGDGGGHQ